MCAQILTFEKPHPFLQRATISIWTDAGNPKRKRNEDRCNFIETDERASAAWVVDGCTDLDDPERTQALYGSILTSASWHAHSLSSALSRTPYAFDQTPQAYLSGIIDRMRHAHGALCLRTRNTDRPVVQSELPAYAFPSSTLIWAGLSPEPHTPDRKLLVMACGDAVAIIRTRNGKTHVFPDLDALHRTRPAIAIRKDPENPSVENNLPWYRAERSVNILSGRTSLSLFPDRMEGVRTFEFRADEIHSVALLSGGAYRLVDPYHILSADQYLDMLLEKGPQRVGQILRSRETDDHLQKKYGEPKRRDDATILLWGPQARHG